MIKIMKVKPRNPLFLFTLGICLLSVNKLRRAIIGYASPRTFSPKEIERSATYCVDVVKKWEKTLINYHGNPRPFIGQNVLELGPGPDLGTGIVLLALGAKSYTAVDKNRLIRRMPPEFYDKLLNCLKEFPGYSRAKLIAENLRKGHFGDDFQYIQDPTFALQMLCEKKFNVIVSQAVLEHIVDIRGVFEVLYNRLMPGAVMAHLVDLGTHTGLIRELDPLNFLRYSDKVWSLLKFSGSPNRLRMSEYKEILNPIGFANVETRPSKVMDEKYMGKVISHFAEKFRKYSKEDLRVKSFYLLATKK